MRGDLFCIQEIAQLQVSKQDSTLEAIPLLRHASGWGSFGSCESVTRGGWVGFGV